ncbi:MAG: RluA family pseudouridine synthase [Deltaproteobacteria bacterium]|nr:RluA family pseudouridine synthase [Deltaproteobacteria bacterium]
METTHSFVVSGGDAARRLDVFVAERVPDITRSRAQALIKAGRVKVNGKGVKAGQKLKVGERVEVEIPLKAPLGVEPEDIPVEVIYEDKDVIVVNKPAGLAVHPGAGRASGTLVNAVLAHTKDISSIGGPLRPGVVHRLDKDTTGVLVMAKNDPSHISLAKQFKDHTSTRKYVALVWGALKEDEGTIDYALGRDTVHRKKISIRARSKRKAVTHYRVLKRYPRNTLIELTLETGRTHQIRVHLAAVNHPVVGDQTYGRRALPSVLPKHIVDGFKQIKRQCLHAIMLGFTHPATGAYMEFSAPMPPDMEGLIKLMEKEYSGKVE